MEESSQTGVTIEKGNTAASATFYKTMAPTANDKGDKVNDQPPPIIKCHATDLNGTKNPQQVVEVAELIYQDFIIKIYTDGAKKDNSSRTRFFFEPIVVLDPKSVIIINQSQELFQEKHFVRFTIQMWTQEIRAKIMELLHPDHPEIKEKDVRVMPYENVRLVVKPGSIHKSVKIMEEATPYRRAPA